MSEKALIRLSVAVGLFAFAALLGVFVGGCQSTQSKSAELEARGADLLKPEGVDIGGENKLVKVVDESLITDKYGTALAVTIKNDSDRFLANLPIQISVLDPKGKEVFSNDQEGLEPTLLGYPLVGPGQTVTWVHDQVLATGTPDSADVSVGSKVTPPPPGEPPQIKVSGGRIRTMPGLGVAIEGTVENLSDIDQVDLIIYAVGRKGDSVVAAGRAGIKLLKAGNKRKFKAFVIGNPQGANLEIEAPPTTLG